MATTYVQIKLEIILSSLIQSIIKQDDSLGSSALHLARAIADLSSLVEDHSRFSIEEMEIINANCRFLKTSKE